FLLIHCLQFGMEKTKYRIAETLCLNHQKLVNGIVGNIFYIYRLLKRGKGIGSLGAHGTHEFVVLIRDSILSSFTRNFVYLLVYFLTLFLVGSTVVLSIKRIDLVE